VHVDEEYVVVRFFPALSKFAEEFGDMFVEGNHVVLDGHHELLEVSKLRSNVEVGGGGLDLAIKEKNFDQEGSTRFRPMSVWVLGAAQSFGSVGVQTVQDALDHHVVVLGHTGVGPKVRSGGCNHVLDGQGTILEDDVALFAFVIQDVDE
jgi:hypothetical protein